MLYYSTTDVNKDVYYIKLKCESCKTNLEIDADMEYGVVLDYNYDGYVNKITLKD